MTFYTRPGTLMLDPSKTAMAGWMATAISIFSIIIAWIAYDLIWRSPLKTKPWAAVTVLTVSLFSYAYWIDGFFNGRFVLLQIGAMIATTMSANVRFVIIPNQKKIMAALLEGKPHDLDAGHQAKMRSLTNNYVTFPVIFLMLSAHFPSIYGDPYYLPIVFIIGAGLVVIKHMMNIYNEFSEWLEVGQKLYASKGCVACHQPVSSSIAPSLVGIYGTERLLETGSSVIADDAYLRESILWSNAKVSHGYAPAMPGYDEAFSEDEVSQMIAYIKSLK